MEFGAGLSPKGQVTVPKRVRDLLGLKAGDRVYFVPEKGHALMVPATGDIFRLKGILRKRPGVHAKLNFHPLRERAKEMVGKAYARKFLRP